MEKFEDSSIGSGVRTYGPSASIRGPLLCQQPQATLGNFSISP